MFPWYFGVFYALTKNIHSFFSGHNYIKDLVLVTSLVIAVGGCWLAYMQHRYSQSQVQKLLCDMKNLQSAEDALGTLKQKSVYPAIP